MLWESSWLVTVRYHEQRKFLLRHVYHGRTAVRHYLSVTRGCLPSSAFGRRVTNHSTQTVHIRINF
jgi:hypothetical protein